MKKIFGAIIILLCCVVAGYAAYKIIPKIASDTYDYLENAGPLGLLLIIGLALAEVVATWAIVKIGFALGFRPFASENKRGIFAIICALIAGFPVTASLSVLFWNGMIGSFSGVLYVLFNGVLFMLVVFVRLFDDVKR